MSTRRVRVLSGIPLDKVSAQCINAPAMILLAMYIIVAESRRFIGTSQRTIQNDILKEQALEQAP